MYATLGTGFNKTPGLLEGIAALRDEPINLTLTVGRDRDPAAFGPQPPNVHVERHVPQSMAFDACDLVVSHCGTRTMLATLDHGLPMVNIPILSRTGGDPPLARVPTYSGLASSCEQLDYQLLRRCLSGHERGGGKRRPTHRQQDPWPAAAASIAQQMDSSFTSK